jgi:hypothetical protein
MESVRVEALLDAYFEGNTTLAEETQLRAYFAGGDVEEHLKPYAAMFAGFEAAQQEVSHQEIELSATATSAKNKWWYGIAALLVVAVGVGSFMMSQPQLTPEEQEALAAYQEAKETMMLLSENLNKGANKLTHISEFTETKNRILK